MTVSGSATIARYRGDGAQTVYPVPFMFYKDTDLRVLQGVSQQSRVMRLGEDYTVAQNAGVGGSVTFTLPPAVDTEVVLRLVLPLEQELDMHNQGTLDLEALELALDKIILILLQHQFDIGRSLKQDETSVSKLPTVEEVLRRVIHAMETSEVMAENAKASEVVAADAREQASTNAVRAEAAQNTILAQVEAVNALMAAELSKINSIIAVNKDQQQAAVERARRWAEQEPGTPVAINAYGDAVYSAKHWAREAQSINIPAPTLDVRGAVRVGEGLALEEGDKLYVSVGPGLEMTNGAVTALDLLETSHTALATANAALALPGMVFAFSGTFGGEEDKFPVNRLTGSPDTSYALCDGGTYTASDGTSVATPDLRGRFILGAGDEYAQGSTGGSAELSGETGQTTLTAAQMPSHNHGQRGLGLAGSQTPSSGWRPMTEGGNTYNYTTHTGGGQGHAHSFYGSLLPPYYALAYIMKL